MFIVSYYTKKISPLYAQTNQSISVFNLENHTTLKPSHIFLTQISVLDIYRITLLSNQCPLTQLKEKFEVFTESHYYQTALVLYFFVFSLRHLQNYTNSQTDNNTCKHASKFEIYTELHYSQTLHRLLDSLYMFETFTELPYSQTNAHLHRLKKSLKYLQNHTTLKQRLCFNFLVFVLRHLRNYTTLKSNKTGTCTYKC